MLDGARAILEKRLSKILKNHELISRKVRIIIED